MNRRQVAAAFVVLLLVLPGVAAGSTRGSPDVDVTLPKNSVAAGEEATLRLSLTNDADLDTVSLTNPTLSQRVTTASAVTVAMNAGDAPVTVETRRQSVGSIPDGATMPVAFDVSVDADAAPGTYRLPVVVEYSHADVVSELTGVVNQETERERLSVTIRVEDQARFEVVDVTSDVRPGSQGTVSLTLENVGSALASDARVRLASTSADLRFGQAAEDSRYVGPWEPGQERTVSYVVTATESARAHPYSFQVSTAFEDDRGRTVTTTPETVGVTPLPDLDFAVRDVSSNLAVGEEATIRGTLVNDGDVTARNAVVTLSTPSRTVALSESTYPVGDLEPGASTPFAFDVAVARTAEDGPRSFSLSVAYEDDDGDAATSDSMQLRRQVAPQPDRLDLRPVNATFGVDTSNRLTVAVTNVGDEPLTDVQARLAPQPPFSSEAPTSYVARLEPGETVRMGFELTVSEDAVESDHAVAVNVTADTPDDRTVLTGPHLVPVTIAEESNPAGQEGIFIAAVVVVAVVIGAGYWWLRQ